MEPRPVLPFGSHERVGCVDCCARWFLPGDDPPLIAGTWHCFGKLTRSVYSWEWEDVVGRHWEWRCAICIRKRNELMRWQ